MKSFIQSTKRVLLRDIETPLVVAGSTRVSKPTALTPVAPILPSNGQWSPDIGKDGYWIATSPATLSLPSYISSIVKNNGSLYAQTTTDNNGIYNPVTGLKYLALCYPLPSIRVNVSETGLYYVSLYFWCGTADRSFVIKVKKASDDTELLSEPIGTSDFATGKWVQVEFSESIDIYAVSNAGNNPGLSGFVFDRPTYV